MMEAVLLFGGRRKNKRLIKKLKQLNEKIKANPEKLEEVARRYPEKIERLRHHLRAMKAK